MTRDARITWRDEQPACWVCGWPERGPRPRADPMNRKECHEMARGAARAKAVKAPETWFATCLKCHEDALAAMPIAKQLRYKKLFDPRNYDRVAVNRLRGRADEAITEAEVDAELDGIVRDLFAGGMPKWKIEKLLDRGDQQ